MYLSTQTTCTIPTAYQHTRLVQHTAAWCNTQQLQSAFSQGVLTYMLRVPGPSTPCVNRLYPLPSSSTYNAKSPMPLLLFNGPSECNDVVSRAGRQQKQRAAGYRTERSLLGCFVLPSKGGRLNPAVPSSRFSVGRGDRVVRLAEGGGIGLHKPLECKRSFRGCCCCCCIRLVVFHILVTHRNVGLEAMTSLLARTSA